MEEYFSDVTVENIYFSDHNAVRNPNEKKSVDFHINP